MYYTTLERFIFGLLHVEIILFILHCEARHENLIFHHDLFIAHSSPNIADTALKCGFRAVYCVAGKHVSFFLFRS